MFSSFRVECCYEIPLDIVKSKNLHGLAVVARQAYRNRTIIYESHSQVIFRKPTVQTVQLDPNQHLYDSTFAFLNHSCVPNAIIDVKTMSLIALRDIEPGEEITIFYPATESELFQKFECRCNQTSCLGRIRGRRFLARPTPQNILRAARTPALFF